MWLRTGKGTDSAGLRPEVKSICADMRSSREYDCVSRSFASKLGIAEDRVCGSGHCHIAPYWMDALEKDRLVAYQASERGGILSCGKRGDRVILAGQAALYSAGELFV